MILIVLLAYLAISLVAWVLTVGSYGLVSLEDDKHAVRYALGSEHGGAEGDPVWTYKGDADAVIRITFTPDGMLRKISCSSPAAEPESCPELYGIGIGETEDVIGGHLGEPGHIRIAGDRKYIGYDSIGATYVLQKFVVTGLVRHADRGSFLGKTQKFLRSLIYLPGSIG